MDLRAQEKVLEKDLKEDKVDLSEAVEVAALETSSVWENQMCKFMEPTKRLKLVSSMLQEWRMPSKK